MRYLFTSLSSVVPFIFHEDLSDAQWRNFRGNLPILTTVFLIYALVANTLRSVFLLRAKGMSIVWLILSFTYLFYLHQACIIFIISIASLNFLLVKVFARTKFFLYLLWTFNLFFLLSNRVFEGYSFSAIGLRWSYMDNFRGTFRWHICFNFVVLRMISFGYDYHWAHDHSHFDQKVYLHSFLLMGINLFVYFIYHCSLFSMNDVALLLLPKSTIIYIFF
ncbi:SPAC24H6.01c [Cucurbita argyrosperma subsp. argyrosperma]|nr:SPAC24H6.01c [Cucurbita argyrosperma subsp. argyrosperma]